MTDVKFSIIIPTYNRANLIGITLKSVLSQDYSDYEVIVVDDGSTDNTEDVVKSFGENNITYIKTNNRERGAARNTGAESAKGDYLYFLDSDDIIYANHLKIAAEFLANKNNPEWFFQEYEIRQSDGCKRRVKYNRKNPIKDLVCEGNFLSCHGVFICKDIFEENPFNEDRELAGSEDYELWIRMAARYPLQINPIVTSALVEHNQRSVFHFDHATLIRRKQKMLKCMFQDTIVRQAFVKYKPKLKSGAASYIALHIALTGIKKNKAVLWWLKSVYHSPLTVLSKRSGAILKQLLTR